MRMISMVRNFNYFFFNGSSILLFFDFFKPSRFQDMSFENFGEVVWNKATTKGDQSFLLVEVDEKTGAFNLLLFWKSKAPAIKMAF